MSSTRTYLTLLCSFLYFSAPLVQAESTPTKGALPDAEHPVHISANSLETHQKKGQSTYKGNVVITQGSLTLKGDVIFIQHPNGTLKHVKATGADTEHLASFKRFSQIEQAWLTGQATTIEYDAAKRTLLLIGHAQIEQPGQHQIKGPKLFYDIKKQTLQAQSTSSEQGRVTVTFNPAPANQE
ncbi:MAG: lipopolysaccharide transport periplasmic protein LptA [Gammaproteobacteria bacterium]|nr:lipopolysaccharide transport periplasmic protein LptA [Gammaproteobacteria bacterium]